MKKHFIPLLAFLVLLLLTIGYRFNFAVSVVPGWHTAILPPCSIAAMAVVIFLLFAATGYWLLSERAVKINRALFITHFILTMPNVIFLMAPSIFVNTQQADQFGVMKDISFRMKLIPAAWILFIAGQALFLIYFIRTVVKSGKHKS